MLWLILFEFSHVEYDPAGSDKNREWVEVRNVSDSNIDLSKYFFVENNTNHRLKASGSSIVPPRAVAIIAADAATFLSEYPSRSPFVFDSSFSLSNDGESLALKDASSTVVAQTTYVATPKPVAEKKKSTKNTATKTLKESPKILERATSSQTASAGASGAGGTGMGYWLAGLLGVILIAGIALFAVTKPAGTGYTIEEES